MPTILARPASLSSFSFFGDLIAQPPLTALARIEASLGSKLIRAEILGIEIQALRQHAEESREKDRWQQTVAMLAVGLLLGAVIGCTLVTRMVGK
jgi:hypothetical protein